MSLKTWAIKPAELKPLDRTGLLLFAARCALRVEPWWPKDSVSLAREQVDLLVSSALGEPLSEATIRPNLRRLSDAGAWASNALRLSDEARGRCHNYAFCALVQALEAATAVDRPTMVKRVIETAKLVGSVPAVWGHAGRVTEASGVDPVDLAATTTWSAMRADILLVAAQTGAIVRSSTPANALRSAGELWPAGVPSWANPP